jgi:hypothetical protein
MSRPTAQTLALMQQMNSVFRWLQTWPKLCIGFWCGGCILGPVELVPDNLPPEILNATSFNQCNANPECIDEDFGSVIRYCQNCQLSADIVASNGLVFAMIDDDQPENLDYRWTLSTSGWLTNAISDDIGTQVVLADIEAADGQTLTLQILDGGDYQVKMSWLLEGL